MLRDACGHRRRSVLPVSFVGALAQGSMGVMKIVAQRANPTERIVPIRPRADPTDVKSAGFCAPFVRCASDRSG